MIISYKNWGEVAAEEFAGFLQYERELSRKEVRLYQSLWDELKEDNSPRKISSEYGRFMVCKTNRLFYSTGENQGG